ncbi:MAG: hypothetical protein KGL43_13875 [Burkholderiales bacterium]|nr:hypothetical protein [Burkholderiales bacterium]MDE2454676.1 hypothetical protein [Burkholderiales bacterium]
MYYVLEQQPLVDEDGHEYGYYAVGPRDDEYTEWPWLEGVRFDPPPAEPLQLRVEADDEDAGDFADYVFGPIPLVTARLREVLTRCAVANLEYYAVQVEGAQDFDDFPAYFAVNVVGKAALADPARSRGLEAFGGKGATLFDVFVPAPGAAQGAELLRMAESMAEVVVSERVRAACEEAGIDTLRFVPLDEWAG